MFRNFIATEQDKKEVAEREKRQNAERERQKRIFDPKTRKIGIDLKGLDVQVQEKKLKKIEEKEWNETLDKQMCNDVEVATILAKREEQEKWSVQNEINNYREIYQKRTDTREYDINDPKFVLKQIPLRTSHTENVTISCGQKFDGEDLRKPEREKVMSKQLSSWLLQQIEEKKCQESEIQRAEHDIKQAEMAQDKRALQLELIERDCQKKLEMARAKYNKILADEYLKKNKYDLQNDDQDRQAEVYNTLTSDLMIENPNAAKSAFGPHRVITYLYKGMSNEEKKKIRNVQVNQIKELNIKKEKERSMDHNWDGLANSLCNFAFSCEKEAQEKKRLTAIKIQEENLELQMQQKNHQKYLNTVVFTNKATEEFFNKFNISSR